MWPGDVTFPDFTNKEAYNYWSELVKKFHDEVNFDGMWIVRFLVKYYHIFICLNSIYILQNHTFIWYLYWHFTVSYINLVFILTYYSIMHLSGIYIDILQYHTFIWYLYWHITLSYIYPAISTFAVQICYTNKFLLYLY